MRTALLGLILVCGCVCAAPELLPWQEWLDVPIEDGSRDLEDLFDLKWRNSGGAEGSLSLSEDPGPWGGRTFEFRVGIDHHNEGKYPQGWPSFETVPETPLDFSGFDAIQYWLRCDTESDHRLLLRFILWTDGENRLNTAIPPFTPGEWVRVTHPIRDIPGIASVDRIHFFLCESDYQHGEDLTFRVGGFRLCNMGREKSRLAAGQIAAGLWVGERADSGDQVVLTELGAETVPALLVVETGPGAELRASDVLSITCKEVFSSASTQTGSALGTDVPEGTVARIATSLPVDDLPAGYYLAVADLRRENQPLLGGRVGSDDFYVRAPDESMTHAVLSIRTGMSLWVRDLLHGGIMCRTRIALPHVYDPLNRETYAEFINLFAHSTGKHTEGNEAGVTGLALAAEAFRKSGGLERAEFTEALLDDSLNHMMAEMQAPSGAAITWSNELADADIGKGSRTNAFGAYDSNQIGEWARCFAYGIIHYSRIPERREYALTLAQACSRAVQYIVDNSLQETDGDPNVMRHLRLHEDKAGIVSQVIYHQEGRQCDVYAGRALAGLSYCAYALQLVDQDIPDEWWQVMDSTVAWADRKMRPNGWFDWQCEDQVEGGCHTFLGNLYIGEGTFGCYIASRLAGREPQAELARAATLKAYRYVTDDCYIHGTKFEYPLEFWVGPYVYWLFTEYLDTAPGDERLRDWLTVLDRRWSEERQWRDFLDRAPSGGCGRTNTNGMLEISILGYLGIRQMADVGDPLHWVIAR